MYFRTFGLSGLGDVVSSLAAFISQHEGYNPNFAANNNPGNLVYVQGGWNYPGAVPGAGGFAKYPDLATGQAALEHQVQVQIASGQNLTQFFNQYAPANTKNGAGALQTSAATQAYIDQAAAALGIDPSTPLNSGSWAGSGSADDSGPSDGSGDSGGSNDALGVDWSSLLPGASSSYDVGGGVVLSGSDLLTLGLAVVAVFAVSSIL